jgi:DHA3 family macrolide efflux protein-like MFS transporter
MDETIPPNGWRTFLIVWFTQALSVFGSAITWFAITIWLTLTAYPAPEQREELAFALAAVGLAFTTAGLIAAPIGGAWADRADRKQIMMVADTVSGLISLALIVLLLTNTLTIWLLVPLIAIAGIANTFHYAAFNTSYAMLVPPERLPRANGMMQTIWSLSEVFAPALAATLIALPALFRRSAIPRPPASWIAGLQDGVPLAMAVDALTFAVAVIALMLVHIPSPKRAELTVEAADRPSIWADVREGARYIWHRPAMLWLLSSYTVANFAGAPLFVLLPLLVRDNLSADWMARGFVFETALAFMNAALSIGGVVGGVLISAWGGLKHRRIYGVVVPMLAVGLLQATFGLSSMLFLTAAIGGALTAMLPIMNAHSQSIWQTQTPHELQGRVFSVRQVIAQFTTPLGTTMAGITGGRFDPGLVIAAMGAVLAIFCAAQLFNPALLRIEDKRRNDETAELQVPTP